MFDLAVIGSGWAGFNAALEAADLGLKVALIEEKDLGGVCLNRGCIPTKALVQSSKVFSLFKKSDHFGIEKDNLKVNFSKIQEGKSKVVGRLLAGMLSLVKRRNITYINKKVRLYSDRQLITNDGEKIDFSFLLIATGSVSVSLPKLEFNHVNILSSDDLLNISSLPKELLVVGGGVIGCEFAQLFSNLGSNVTIVEIAEQLIPGLDTEIANKLALIFKKQNIKVLLKTDVFKLDLNAFEKILVSVGRVPNLDGLGLEAVGVKIENNRIVVNDVLQTNVDNIFAAGDCLGRLLLAHTASYEGRQAAKNIYVGYKGAVTKFPIDYNVVPNCIFTDPQIASIGISEQEAKNSSKDYEIKKFFFLGSGMAHIQNETDGFVKLVVNKKDDTLLGAQILGPEASELINIISLTMNNNLKLADLAKSIFAHPSLSEILSEAARISP
jgi:dihydrolipoamide dehydrogenase